MDDKEEWFQATLQRTKAGDLLAQTELLVDAGEIARAKIRMQPAYYLKAAFGEEDAVQEVVLAVQLRQHQFRGTTYGQFVSWIQTITQNTLYREISRKSNQSQHVSDFESALQQLGNVDWDTPSAQVRAEEWHGRVVEAIKELSEKEKLLVQQRLKDIPFAAIATALSYSNEMAARRAYDVVLQKLRDLVGDPNLSSWSI